MNLYADYTAIPKPKPNTPVAQDNAAVGYSLTELSLVL